ncbi:HCL524Cp [Eremothecium sinecaudum]|uniref:HCL524Cp n=1 Tax=Eremothecium sinecaudum TaxID=45286 RepID=A0A109UYS5_9SACH|nr:HCL524Cp [Eremothecium sinecaudum]AMD19627.1 HCL524Cp [Eremothecium sinecaudum]
MAMSRTHSSPRTTMLGEIPTNTNIRINDTKLKLTHSPARSAAGNENEVSDNDQPPMKRIKMDSIPILTRPDGIGMVSSPEPIEMLDGAENFQLTSPIRRSHNNAAHDQDHVDQQDMLDIQDDIKKADTTAFEDTEVGGFEKMTPIKAMAESVPKNLSEELHKMQDVEVCEGESATNKDGDIQGTLEVTGDDWVRLGKILERKNEKIQQLTKDVREVQDQLWELTKSKESLEVSYCMQGEKLRELKQIGSSYEELVQKFDEATNLKEALEAKAERLRARGLELKNELTMAMQNSQILKEKYEAQAAKNEELEQQVSSNAEIIETYQDRLKHSEAELDGMKIEIDELNEKLATAEEQMVNYEDKVKEEQARAQELEASLAEKAQQVEELNKTIAQSKDARDKSSSELQTKIEELNKENSILEREYSKLLKDYEVETKELGSQIAKLTEELASTNANSEKYANDLENLQVQNSDLQSHVNELEAQLEESNNEVVSKQGEISELTGMLQELRESEKYLQETINNNEQLVADIQAKLAKKEEELKLQHAEYESVLFKNGNMEAEHLAELEQLHENMAKFQGMIESLSAENDSLKEKLSSSKQPAAPQSNPSSPQQSNTQLQERITALEAQLAEKDKDTNQRLQMLAEDLYIQYSSKHEQKVKMLKKSYETKYQESMDKLQLENSALADEVAQLQKKMEIERREKQELINLLDK